MKRTSTLVVVPARAGSKGIPRKNLCPIAGKPLIAWAIASARRAELCTRVVVSTESDEIATVARRFGADVVMRPEELAFDDVTLDPVVAHAVLDEERRGRVYDIVATVQATSPLIQPRTIDRIILRLSTEPLDSVLTAIDDTHLAWVEEAGTLRPDYAARVNRQALPKRFKETGGVIATRREAITSNGRIGKRVGIEVLSGLEGLDIDTREDWLMAEVALQRKRIAFIVIGNREQGLGHVGRCLTLLECLNGHETLVLCDPDQDLAIERLRRACYPVEVVPRERCFETLQRFGADVVVHDQLSTPVALIESERRAGMSVVVFEDCSPSADRADAVFNALYPGERSQPERRRFYGPSVYCLRDEFRHAERAPFRDPPERLLITFGGTDPSELTERVLGALALALDLSIRVVVGPGNPAFARLASQAQVLRTQGVSIEVLKDVDMMSTIMASADIAFSSAGRTLYELAYMGVPTIVLAQNERELNHTFASLENGFLCLGLGSRTAPSEILAAYQSLRGSRELRRALRERMLACDLTSGRDFVVQQILEAPRAQNAQAPSREVFSAPSLQANAETRSMRPARVRRSETRPRPDHG